MSKLITDDEYKEYLILQGYKHLLQSLSTINNFGEFVKCLSASDRLNQEGLVRSAPLKKRKETVAERKIRLPIKF